MSRLTLCFKLTLEDGTLVDEAGKDDPLRITPGDGVLHPALEACLEDLQPGERNLWILTPEEGFGLPDPAAFQSMPKHQFPADQTLEVGTLMSFSLPSGEEVAGLIESLDEDNVMVNFNHPLAGHTLSFDVLLLNREG